VRGLRFRQLEQAGPEEEIREIAEEAAWEAKEPK
jgi:hypothetical protein